MRGDEEGLLTDITLNILGTFSVVKKKIPNRFQQYSHWGICGADVKVHHKGVCRRLREWIRMSLMSFFCRRWTDFQRSWQVVFCSLLQLFSRLTNLGIIYSASLHEHFYAHLDDEGSEICIQPLLFFFFFRKNKSPQKFLPSEKKRKACPGKTNFSVSTLYNAHHFFFCNLPVIISLSQPQGSLPFTLRV